MIWLKAGDDNTNFFHKVDNQTRIQNSIWDSIDGFGGITFNQLELDEADKIHSSTHFTKLENANIVSYLQIVQNYQKFFLEKSLQTLGHKPF